MVAVPGSLSSRGPTNTFTAELWEHDGPTAWYFVSLPEELTDDLDERHGHETNGFGSLRVDVRIGETRWATSVFPDTKRGTFILPVKKAVRRAEGLVDGDEVTVHLTVIDPSEQIPGRG